MFSPDLTFGALITYAREIYHAPNKSELMAIFLETGRKAPIFNSKSTVKVKKLSQDSAARLIGISRQTLIRYENNTGGRIDLYSMALVCRFYNLDWDLCCALIMPEFRDYFSSFLFPSVPEFSGPSEENAGDLSQGADGWIQTFESTNQNRREKIFRYVFETSYMALFHKNIYKK